MPWEPSRSWRRKEGEQRSGKKTRRMKTRECLELWSGLNKEVVTSGDDVAERQTGPQVPLPFGFDNREVTQQEHLGQGWSCRALGSGQRGGGHNRAGQLLAGREGLAAMRGEMGAVPGGEDEDRERESVCVTERDKKILSLLKY